MVFSSLWRNLPNILSGFRLCLAIPLVLSILYEETVVAVWTLIVGAISDWADGFIARRYSLQSEVGAWLDPFADKVILNSTFMTLAFRGILPVWLAVMLLIRDLVIIAGAFAVYKVKDQIEGKANFFGKISTLFQFGLLIWCVVFPAVAIPFSVIVGVLAVTVLSGLHYVDTWSRWTFKAYRYSGK